MWLANNYTAQRYFESVNEAVQNEEFFRRFKSDIRYKSIVGMSTSHQGEVWLNYIQTRRPDLLDKLRIYAQNDSIGSPENMLPIGDFSLSPNTLRYLNTAIQIEDYFGFTEKIRVNELGIGYGGLAFVMNCHFLIESYGLLDVSVVQTLATKYLNRLKMDQIQTEFVNDPDIFISEFCFSEFDDEEMYQFYDKYILRSKNLYLSMNMHEESRKKKFIDTLRSDFTFEIFDEFPKTQWPNYIIMGSRK